MCTDDFYEGQMRLDGPFCDYTKEEKLEFLHRLRDMGVKNIEMECTCLASFTHRLGMQGG
jgi:uridine phosphorylase